MKTAAIGILIIGGVMTTACVTESAGIIIPEAAPEEEQAEVNLALGISYLQEGRADLAIEPLLRAINARPRSAEAHMTIAVAYDQEGAVELAEEHHQRATQIAPRNANIQNAYAVFLCRQGRWDDAAPYYSRAIGATSRDASVNLRMNAAFCAYRAGDMAAAEQHFREVLAIEASHVDALRAMVDVSIRSENYIAGRAFWQRLEAVTEPQAEDLESCFMIERQLNAQDVAQACADRLEREFPGSASLARIREIGRNGG